MSNSTHLLNNARAQERVDELETQIQAHTKGEAMWEFEEHEKQCNCQSCLQREIAEMDQICVQKDEEMARLQAEVERLERLRNFDTGTTPLPKGLVLEHTRLDNLWQKLVIEKQELMQQLVDQRVGIEYAEVAFAVLKKEIRDQRAIIDGLVGALRSVSEGLNCRDGVHYCPNCDKSMYKIQEKANAALAAAER